MPVLYFRQTFILLSMKKYKKKILLLLYKKHESIVLFVCVSAACFDIRSGGEIMSRALNINNIILMVFFGERKRRKRKYKSNEIKLVAIILVREKKSDKSDRRRQCDAIIKFCTEQIVHFSTVSGFRPAFFRMAWEIDRNRPRSLNKITRFYVLLTPTRF